MSRRRSAVAGFAICGAIALTLAIAAAAPAGARPVHGAGKYAVARPVFHLAGLGRSRWPGRAAFDARAQGRHVPNPDFAGYLAKASGPPTVVTRFKVPDESCTRKETAIGPGAFLLTGPTDRLLFNAANIIIGCYRGVATAQQALVVNDVEFDYARDMQPGDQMVARVTDEPGERTVVELSDLTPGHRFVLRRSGRGAAPNLTLVGDWGSIDADTQVSLPPPDFEPTRFRSVAIDGRPLGPSAQLGFDMASSNNVLQITTSPVFGSQQDMFTCTRS